MSDFDWLIIQLQLLVFGFIGFVLLMVFGPVALIIHAARKKKPEECNGTSTPEPSSATPGVMVSKDDGRVIAMEAPAPQPAVHPAVTPQKQGLHPLTSFALKVLGKVAVAVVMGQLKHPHHKK